MSLDALHKFPSIPRYDSEGKVASESRVQRSENTAELIDKIGSWLKSRLSTMIRGGMAKYPWTGCLQERVS